MKLLRNWRLWAMLALPIAVIAANSYGPDGWREPLVRLLWLSWAALAIVLTYGGRRALFPYARAHDAWSKLLEHPIGAGLGFLGLSIVTAALFFGLTSFARAAPLDVQTYVPINAQRLAPVARSEIERTWPAMPLRSYLGALVEQETCTTLTSRSCWSPTARLKTSREEGAGLSQLTRAWDASGRLRFDALAEVKAMAPADLAQLDWATVYTRADLGLRATLVKLKDCDARLQRLGGFEPAQRVAFCDAAYNGGWGGMLQDRRLCAARSGCDPSQWFGHVETTSGKSRVKWQGYGQSAFDINRSHVRNTLQLRRPKYVALLGV